MAEKNRQLSATCGSQFVRHLVQILIYNMASTSASSDSSLSGERASRSSSPSDNESAVSKRRRYESSHRLCHEEWQDTYPWARFDLRQKMYCQVCTDQKKAASLTFSGTNRIKKCVLEDHSKSRKHNEAVQDAKMRNVTAKAVLKVFTFMSLQLAAQSLWDFYFQYRNCS